jgi:phenylpyruvate tautomerase PptA (4-oxalocrotonate tautomerase family)
MRNLNVLEPTLHPEETIMPFARIDLLKGKTAEYRATVADVVYKGIVEVLKAPDGDRFIVIGEHSSDNLIYDPPLPRLGSIAWLHLDPSDQHCRQ